MKFSRSIFGEQCSIFLNNFFSPVTKYNELIDSYNQLKILLISGQTKFPKLTLQLSELIDVNNITYLNTFIKLTKLSGTNIVGYSKTKIYEQANENIDNKLEDLESEYRNIILQLQLIFDIMNKNIHDYRLIIYLLTNIDTILRSNTTFDIFTLYNSVFRFLYEKEPLSSNFSSTYYKDEQVLTIPTLISIQFFKKLFLNVTDSPPRIMLQEIYSDPTIVTYTELSHLSDDYSNYITTNALNISTNLVKFIYNTIFDFGVNVADNFVTKSAATLMNLVIKTKDIVSNNLSIIAPVDYIYRLSTSVTENVILNTLLGNLLFKSSPIWELNKYTGYDDVFHDKVYQWEDVIFANVEKWYSKMNEKLDLINYIHTKFAFNPIFAVNAHAIVYAKVALDYLSGTSLFTNDDVESWLNNTLNESNININNIITLMQSMKLIYDKKCYDFAAFLIFQEFIDNLVKCSDFQDYLVNEFIPVLNNFVRKEYYMDINWHQKIDDIKYIFKLLLCNDLIDGLNGDNLKLFYGINNVLSNLIKNKLSTYIWSGNASVIRTTFLYERSNINKWYYIFNSFFKNAILAKYTSVFLQENYSL